MQYSENYNMFLPGYGDPSLVDNINDNTETIDGLIHDNRTMMAPSYDSALTYAVGDIVERLGKLYRCIAETTGTWDAAKWTLTTLADECEGGGGTAGDVTKTVSGSTLEIADAAAAPFVGLTSAVEGTQSGSGTPSPENVRPITGCTQTAVTVADASSSPSTSTTYTATFVDTAEIFEATADLVNKRLTITKNIIALGSANWTKYKDSGATYFYTYIPKMLKLSTEGYICTHYAPKSGSSLADLEIGITIGSGGVTTDTITIRDDSQAETSASAFKTYLSSGSAKLAYTCSSAVTGTLSLSAYPVKALSGSNYITSTTGDLTAEYITEDYQPLVNPEDMVGATSNRAGEHGLVPAPQSSDRDKFLKGDGTWAAVSSGANALADLTDVEITSPTDGQALLFDDSDDTWKNQTIPKVEANPSASATDDLEKLKVGDTVYAIPDPSVTAEATGNPIELTDAASAPMVKCVTQITGSQDLHGYDKPWVGGAGKNLVDWKASFNSQLVKSFDTSGYYTVSGESTFSPGAWYIKVKKSDETYYDKSELGYYISQWTTAGSDPKLYVSNTNIQYFSVLCPNDGDTIYLRKYDADGTISVQIEKGTAVTSFAPYSNICPITAYTEGEIEVRGKNVLPFQTETKSYLGVTATPLNNGRYNFTGTATGNSAVQYSVTINGAGIYRFIIDNYTVISGSNITLYYRTKGGGKTQVLYPDNTIDLSVYEIFSIAFYANSGTTVNYYNVGLMLVKESYSDKSFEPCTSTTHTTTYPSAIYRGSEDVVKGEVSAEKLLYTISDGTGAQGLTALTNVTRVIIDINATQLKSRGTHISSYLEYIENYTLDEPHFYFDSNKRVVAFFPGVMTGDQWRAYIASNPLQIAYELNTPTTSPVTPTNLPIKSLSGYSHIESSTGDMEVEYITEGYQPLIDATDSAIEEHGKTIESIITDNLEPLMVASRNYSIGELIISGDKAYRATANIASGATLTVGTNVVATTIEEEIGRSGHVYSTDEKVVGTWIDGSTLYERTIYVENPTKGGPTNSKYYYSVIGVSGIDVAFKVSSCIYDSNDARWYSLPYNRILDVGNIYDQTSVISNEFRYDIMFDSSQDYNITKIAVTYRYTKL